jgi:hypothetical protein
LAGQAANRVGDGVRGGLGGQPTLISFQVRTSIIGEDRMMNLRSVTLLSFLTLAPVTHAVAGPAEDAGAVLDRWAAAYNANDAEALLKLYGPDATLLAR